jgi:predicted flap endonuclease-1-like 5' DNA nuclease
LEQELTEKQEKILTIESDFRNWKNESIEKTTTLSKDNDGLNEKIRNLEGELADKNNQWSEAKTRYETEVNDLGDIIEDQKIELNTWIKKYNQLSEDKELAIKNYQLLEQTTKVEVASLKGQIEREQSTNTSLQEVSIKQADRIKELEDQLVSAEEKSSTNKIGWDAAVMSLGVLQGKYDTKEKDYNDLYNEVTSLKEELTEEQDKIVAIETNFSAWKEESIAKTTTLTQEKASLTEKVTDLGVTITKHKIKIDELEKIKDKHLVEISTWHKKYNQLSRDKEVVAKNYQLLEEKIKVDIEGLEGAIEQEKSINLGLKSSNDQLQEKTNQQTEKIIDLESRLEKLEIETAERIATITNDFSTKNVAYQKEIEELEEIIEDQMHQKERNSQLLEELRVNLTKVKKEKDLGDKEIIRLQRLLAKLEKEQKELDAVPATPLTKEEVTLQRIKEKAQQIDFGRIGVASYADRDDLKKIKGIGVFIEKKLYALGIYTFWQIANLSLEDEEKVNQAIEFFPGRIRRDEWVRQGGELHKEKEDEKEENK